MKYKDLNEEEMDKYDAALVAISDKISIIHKLNLHKEFLADLINLIPEEIEALVSNAKEMDIGNNRLRDRKW